MPHLSYAKRPIAQPHSGRGIASFAIACLAGLCFAYHIADLPYVAKPNPDVEAVGMYGLSALAAVILSSIGLIFAIIGCRLPERRLFFSKLGLGMNIFTLVPLIMEWCMPR